MHDQLPLNWDHAVADMTDEEKRALLKRLEESMGSKNGNSGTENDDEAIRRQNAAIRSWLEEIEKLPCSPEPEDGFVPSIDHDKILYDGSSHAGFPERPCS